jgi:hypothetical protein
MSNTSYLQPHEYTIFRLKNLLPGESFIYFTGFLDEVRLKARESTDVQIANAAWQLYEDNKILLTQRRRSLPLNHLRDIDWSKGKGIGFDYIATAVLPKKITYDAATHPIASLGAKL